MPKTPSRKPAKKRKTPSGAGRSTRQGSSSTPGTTRAPRPDVSALKTPMSERDSEKIVSILGEMVVQITDRVERRLDVLHSQSAQQDIELKKLRVAVRALKDRTNEAAVALLQR